jgi:NAD(P)-dependent dehydrogenase (short-subunit alcohol dehydrogenase family)
MITDTNKKLAIVCGAGPGLGLALSRKLLSRDYQVVGINRSAVLESIDGMDEVDWRQQDLSQPETTQALMTQLVEQYGAPHIYIHNPAHLVIKPFEQTSATEFEQSWQSMVMSAFVGLQAVLPAMANRGSGAVIVSGATASLRGGNRFSAFASAKFALRGLTQSIAREYQSQGIHVIHAILDGIVDTPRSRKLHDRAPETMMRVEDIATAFLQVLEQPRSTWTHELDLRPSTESF